MYIQKIAIILFTIIFSSTSCCSDIYRDVRAQRKNLPDELQSMVAFTFDFGLPGNYRQPEPGVRQLTVGHAKKLDEYKKIETDGYYLSLLYFNDDTSALEFVAHIIYNAKRRSPALMIALIDQNITLHEFSNIVFGPKFSRIWKQKLLNKKNAEQLYSDNILEDVTLQQRFKQAFCTMFARNHKDKIFLFPSEVTALNRSSDLQTLINKPHKEGAIEPAQEITLSNYIFLEESDHIMYDPPLECINPDIESPLVLNNKDDIAFLIERKYIKEILYSTELGKDASSNIKKPNLLMIIQKDNAITFVIGNRCYKYNTQITLPIVVCSYFLHLQKPYLDYNRLDNYRNKAKFQNEGALSPNTKEAFQNYLSNIAYCNKAIKALRNTININTLYIRSWWNRESSNVYKQYSNYMQFIKPIPTELVYKWRTAKNFLLHPHGKVAFAYTALYCFRKIVPPLSYIPMITQSGSIFFFTTLLIRGFFRQECKNLADNIHYNFSSPYRGFFGPLKGILWLCCTFIFGLPEVGVALCESVYERYAHFVPIVNNMGLKIIGPLFDRTGDFPAHMHRCSFLLRCQPYLTNGKITKNPNDYQF